MLPRKCTPPDPLPPSLSDQHGEPIVMPCFFPIPPLDQLTRKMPRVQNLVEPAGGLPFINVENNVMVLMYVFIFSFYKGVLVLGRLGLRDIYELKTSIIIIMLIFILFYFLTVTVLVLSLMRMWPRC